ncbi:hypothetical protein [Bacillus sp. OK048]|nr:hypothetical protein [Bacillus sp. OK048]SDN04398.1 hypothetical protein SAMN05443253_107262 [Bacillus sp. OK048]
MDENKLLLSHFTNDEGFELTNYLTHLFELVSHQLVQNPTAATTSEENS